MNSPVDSQSMSISSPSTAETAVTISLPKSWISKRSRWGPPWTLVPHHSKPATRSMTRMRPTSCSVIR